MGGKNVNVFGGIQTHDIQIMDSIYHVSGTLNLRTDSSGTLAYTKKNTFFFLETHVGTFFPFIMYMGECTVRRVAAFGLVWD